MNIELPEALKHTPQNLYLCIDSQWFEPFESILYRIEPDPEWAWLYQGTPLAGMKEQGPVLVKVSVNSPLLEKWLTEGYQKQWGILLTSDATLDTVLTHCQWLSRVRYPCGTVMIFRYYAPEVAYSLFNKATEEERSQLLGPIASVGIPDADKKQHRLWQQKASPEQALPEKNTLDSPLFQVSEPLFAALQQPAQNKLKQALITHMQTCFPERWQQWQVKAKERNQPCSDESLAETLLQRAHALSFEDEPTLLQFASILGWLDWAVLETDNYPECKTLLTQPSPLTPAMRIQQAESMAEYAATS